MLYKTIVLELIQARPVMHEQLRQQRKMLAALDYYAQELKALHEKWKQRLPENQAAEMAISELVESLPIDSESLLNEAFLTSPA